VLSAISTFVQLLLEVPSFGWHSGFFGKQKFSEKNEWDEIIDTLKKIIDILLKIFLVNN
jgi:hypothetical protein